MYFEDRRDKADGPLTCHLDRIANNSRQSCDSSMKYKIRLQQSEEGYSVSVPGLPGCWCEGATEQEAIENIQDAIREYLAAVNEPIWKRTCNPQLTTGFQPPLKGEQNGRLVGTLFHSLR